jgi:hypothetical protein
MKIENSSLLAEVEYNNETQELKVQFINGAEYVYENVPASEFEMLTTAESAGQAFQQIKNNYTYQKLNS